MHLLKVLIYILLQVKSTPPHEAWHVVQQKQGSIAYDSNERKIPINNDRNLEKKPM